MSENMKALRKIPVSIGFVQIPELELFQGDSMGLDVAVCKAVFFGDKQLNPFWEWFVENETERFYAIDEGNGFAEVSFDRLREKMKEWIEEGCPMDYGEDWKHSSERWERLLEEFTANATEKADEHHDVILWFNW